MADDDPRWLPALFAIDDRPHAAIDSGVTGRSDGCECQQSVKWGSALTMVSGYGVVSRPWSIENQLPGVKVTG
jgi:hypothetical protein